MTQKTYHFIGIGGVGMCGLALRLLQKGVVVSGSDMNEGPLTEAIRAAGGVVHIGHNSQNIPTGATVVYTTDIKKDNLELLAAQDQGCQLLHRSQMLQELMSEVRHPLCVAGTHGKTTTSSLLAWMLHVAGKTPLFAIGGTIPQLKSSASSDYFVAEACESDGTFLNYTPYGAIVTNIDDDHMDFYKDFKTLKKAFAHFMDLVANPECLFYCGDDPHLASMAKRGVSYGYGECQLKVSMSVASGWTQSFSISFKGKIYSDIILNLAGKHNVLNAAAVFGLGIALGLPETDIRKALTTFGGALRRCEKKGERGGVLFIDDYGHHPTEIKTTLAGIRASIGNRRLIVAYQPHRYTRSQTCLGKYQGSFDDADMLIVTGIYAAREAPIAGVTSQIVSDDIRKGTKCPSHYAERNELARFIADRLEGGDVVVTVGAGDITKLSAEIMEAPAYGAVG